MKEVDECQKHEAIRSLKRTANQTVEWECGRGSRRGQMVCSKVKY
jgi:hypothetical protein